MALELAIRWRCQECGQALEELTVLPQPRAFPAPLTVTFKGRPPGWEVDVGGALFCPQHPPRRVLPVTMLPDVANLKQ